MKEAQRAVRDHKAVLLDNNLPGTFHMSSHTNLLSQDPTPLSTNDPFVDIHANPALVRGVPTSQKQLELSYYDRKAYFISSPERPFYTVTDGNKSSVLPNDLFDVMAEAEYTGGAVQRHLGHRMGVTSRFGLAECVDHRPVSPTRVCVPNTNQPRPTNTPTHTSASQAISAVEHPMKPTTTLPTKQKTLAMTSFVDTKAVRSNKHNIQSMNQTHPGRIQSTVTDRVTKSRIWDDVIDSSDDDDDYDDNKWKHYNNV